MKINDFDMFDITKEEVLSTGANIDGLDYDAMCIHDSFRKLLPSGCRVEFLPNGLNSGDHKSEGHKKGTAHDFTVVGPASLFVILHTMIRAGYNGIGIYHNGVCYSFHGETGNMRSWVGWKKKGEKNWRKPYLGLINDPKNYSCGEGK
jgi:hypothetical protein